MFRKTLTAFVPALMLGLVGLAALPARSAGATEFHRIVITAHTPAEKAHLARVIRAHGGQPNRAVVAQNGRNNRAGIGQRGHANSAFIGQYGNGNTATVGQRGRHNNAAVIQIGNNASSHVRQRGQNRHSLVIVYGEGTFYDTQSWIERGR